MPNPVTALYERIELENAAKEEVRFPLMRRIDTPVPERVDKHPAGAYLISTHTPMSRDTALSALNTAVRLLGQEDIKSTPWHLIRYYEMNMLRSMLAEHYAPATANKILSIVRGVLRQAWKLGLTTTDDYRRAIAVPAIPGSRLPAGRALEPGEIRALFQACAEPGPQAARDAALLAILFGCGLRRTEAARLDVEDLDKTASTLRIIGKGNHERIAHMNAGGPAARDAWLKARGDRPGPLLCAITGKGNRIVCRRLRTESIRLILKRRARQARIRSTPGEKPGQGSADHGAGRRPAAPRAGMDATRAGRAVTARLTKGDSAACGDHDNPVAIIRRTRRVRSRPAHRAPAGAQPGTSNSNARRGPSRRPARSCAPRARDTKSG